MTPSVLLWIEQVIPLIPKFGKVLEVGSLDINGNPRHLFKGCDNYIGVDQTAGPNVDVVCNAHNLSDIIPADSIDTLLCFETLEHDPKIWLSLEQFRKVLKTGGYMLISVPSIDDKGYIPIHRFPKDYCRFLPDAFTDIFFEGFELLNMSGTIEVCLCGIGKKLGG